MVPFCSLRAATTSLRVTSTTWPPLKTGWMSARGIPTFCLFQSITPARDFWTAAAGAKMQDQTRSKHRRAERDSPLRVRAMSGVLAIAEVVRSWSHVNREAWLVASSASKLKDTSSQYPGGGGDGVPDRRRDGETGSQQQQRPTGAMYWP